MKNPSFLIILLGSLGDVVRALSLLEPIKKQYPESEITWLVDSRWSSLIEKNENIDDIIVFERKITPLSISNVLKKLREKEYDIVFDLQRILKSGLLSFFTKSDRKICFNKQNSKEFNYIFNSEQIAFYPDSLSKIHHYHQFLSHVDIKTNEPYTFGLDNIETNLAKTIKNEDTITFVLGSTWKTKDWSTLNYIELAKKIIKETDKKILLLGTEEQSLIAKEILLELDKSRFIDLSGKTSLVDLVAIISNTSLVVGPDSGPAHLSACVSTPYITLFGPTSPNRVAAYGMDKYALVSKAKCAPCVKKTCPLLEQICMDMLTPDIVYSKIKDIYNA